MNIEWANSDHRYNVGCACITCDYGSGRLRKQCAIVVQEVLHGLLPAQPCRCCFHSEDLIYNISLLPCCMSSMQSWKPLPQHLSRVVAKLWDHGVKLMRELQALIHLDPHRNLLDSKPQKCYIHRFQSYSSCNFIMMTHRIEHK